MRRTTKLLARTTALAALASVALGGCVYDYANNSDRIGYGAGDAVKANLERETIDPSSDTMTDPSGLGQDGVVTEQ